MTKGEFFLRLNEWFQNASVTEINETLKSIKYIRWVMEYLEQKNQGYVQCKNCDEYVRIAECQVDRYVENHFWGLKKVKVYIYPICGEVAGKDEDKDA